MQWVRRFVRFHGNRHPAELGPQDIATFLTSLAGSASTQNQALAAILFFYRAVLDKPVGWISVVARPQRPQRMPCVLTRAEVRSILGRMRGVERLVVGLLYGSGLRLLEALHLRIKDVDFERHEIMVRRGKGAKDRITVLADAQRLPLARYLDALRDRFRRTPTTVELPDALKKKCPNADREWCWQWVFPGRGGRYHLHPTAVQRAFRAAVRVQSQRRATVCATRLRPICSKGDMTSARSRSCSGIAMCERRCCTRMSSIEAAWPSAALGMLCELPIDFRSLTRGAACYLAGESA